MSQFFWGAAASAPAAPAAFPQIAAVAAYQNNSAATSHPVTLPSGIVAGNLLLMCARTPSTFNIPTGWTNLANRSSNGNSRILWKWATGSEGATQTVSTGSGRFVAQTFRITGAAGAYAEFQTINTTNSPDIDATEVGIKKYTWIAGMTGRRSSWTVYDSPWFDVSKTLLTRNSTISTNTAYLGICTEHTEIETDYVVPGGWTFTGTPDSPHAFTIELTPV